MSYCRYRYYSTNIEKFVNSLAKCNFFIKIKCYAKRNMIAYITKTKDLYYKNKYTHVHVFYAPFSHSSHTPNFSSSRHRIRIAIALRCSGV